MTQYFFVDESGDPGLEGEAGSSSHFVITMVQLPERVPLYPLAQVRKTLGLSPTFEFKYYKTATAPKDRFFREVLSIPFRVRAACARADSQSMKIACFGDNMRDVAVTEGSKIAAQIQLGYDFYG